MKRIVAAGTKTGKMEEQYVRNAVRHLGDPKKFNYYIENFEKRFAEYVRAKYAVATTNGTAALHLGLLALGIGKGDEVILPDMTYVACANVIAYTGATPVFVDVDPKTWCIDPESIKSAITERTKAIMPVWMYGNVPDMEKIKEVAGDIPIIEDSCPAVGSYACDLHAGTVGNVGCFSFQGAKVLAIGEGGMMVTDDEKIYKEARLFADMYTVREFWQTKIGYMYEMNNISAAIGLAQLRNVDNFLDKKAKIYEWYANALSGLFQMNDHYDRERIYTTSENIPNYWMSSIVVPTPEYRDRMRRHLKRHKIDTRPFFFPISMLGLYPKRYETPKSYDIALRGINLPSTVRLSEEEVKYVIVLIKDFATNYLKGAR